MLSATFLLVLALNLSLVSASPLCRDAIASFPYNENTHYGHLEDGTLFAVNVATESEIPGVASFNSTSPITAGDAEDNDITDDMPQPGTLTRREDRSQCFGPENVNKLASFTMAQFCAERLKIPKQGDKLSPIITKIPKVLCEGMTMPKAGKIVMSKVLGYVEKTDPVVSYTKSRNRHIAFAIESIMYYCTVMQRGTPQSEAMTGGVHKAYGNGHLNVRVWGYEL